jgi:hypothetical protein
MNSPRQKYESDPMYHNVVNAIHNLIETCQLTPLEVREAAMLACIHYEARRMPEPMLITKKACECLDFLYNWRNGKPLNKK